MLQMRGYGHVAIITNFKISIIVKMTVESPILELEEYINQVEEDNFEDDRDDYISTLTEMLPPKLEPKWKQSIMYTTMKLI